MGLTNEEMQRFNTIVENLDAPAIQPDNSNARRVIFYCLILLFSMAGMVGSIIIQQVLLGVACFGVMVYAANGLYGLSRFARDN